LVVPEEGRREAARNFSAIITNQIICCLCPIELRRVYRIHAASDEAAPGLALAAAERPALAGSRVASDLVRGAGYTGAAARGGCTPRSGVATMF